EFRWSFYPSRAGLAVAADAVFEAGELFDADGAAGVHFAGGDADFAAETEFAAVGELGGGVVQQDGAVDFAEELLNSSRVLGDDRFGVVAGIVLDMRDGVFEAVDHFDRDDGVLVFGAPILFSGRF